jgi:hypothetical protein
VIIGTGMVLLALTRPYEGIFFCVPVFIYLLAWALSQQAPTLKTLLVKIALPASLTLALGLGWMAYYFWRVTGSPFTTPYQINIQTYGLVYFPWQELSPISTFHHQMMQLFYRGISVPKAFNFARHHPFELQGTKALGLWLFFFGPLLTMPWLAWLSTRPIRGFWSSIEPDLRFLLTLCASTYFSIMLTIYAGQPHYAAPLTAVVYAATILVVRDLRLSASGRWLGRSFFLGAMVVFGTVVLSSSFHSGPHPSWIRIWCTPSFQNLGRAGVLNQLEQAAGDHIVVVRYRPDHDFAYDEWVFNKADINGSKVIWARDMGKQNAELLQYFNNRKAWLVEPDNRPVNLIPYVP